MYARVTIATAQSGKTDEVIKAVRDSVLPAIKKQKGFKKLYHLTDYSTGKGIVIVFWDTENDMKAAETGYFAKVGQLSGPPDTGHYEVSVQG